ncbi:MAG: hypothetical protein ACTS73_06770 [Arsenophonus sp. NEOnobi-MAG3]
MTDAIYHRLVRQDDCLFLLFIISVTKHGRDGIENQKRTLGQTFQFHAERVELNRICQACYRKQ